MNKTEIAEKVKVTLSDLSDTDDQSNAKVEEHHSDENVWITNSLSLYVHADTEDRNVWISISGHTYASPTGIAAPSFTTNYDLIGHHFTEEQARALLAILSHEVSKLDQTTN